MDIKFACPHCQQELVVDCVGAGDRINCPSCQNALQIPLPKQSQAMDISKKMVFLGAASLSLSSILMILFVTTNNTPRFEETANEWQITRLTKQIADVNNLIITKPDHNGTEYMKANNRYQKAVAKKIQSQVDDLRAEQVRATLKRLYSKEPQRNWSIILFWSSLGLFIIAWVIKPSRTA